MAVSAGSGGETSKDPSGWTVDTLRSTMDQRIDDLAERLLMMLAERDRRYEQRFESQQEAIRRAEQATEKRFESVNEFRAQLSDQAREFIPRQEAIQRADANAEKISLLDKRMTEGFSNVNSRLDLSAGRSVGLDKGWGMLVGVVGLAAAVIAIILNLNP